MPRLEVVSASQPLEQQPAIGALRTRTLTSHHMKRATFGTLGGDLALSWLNRLSDLFQLPAPCMPAPVAVSESSTHLSLEDCALGYMPPAAAAAAAPQSLNAAAFVAFARGLHTYTAGSARHVDVTAVHVAVGRVRSGGLAPWACAPPPVGWTAQSCAALGLDLIASEDAACVVLDAAAPVDSDPADALPPAPAATDSAAAPAPCLAASEHPGIGAFRGPAGADPLLAHVQRRRAAEERLPFAAADPRPVRVSSVAGGPPRAAAASRRPCPHVLRQPAPAPASAEQGLPTVDDHEDEDADTGPATTQLSHSGSSKGMQVFAGSPGDSDVEVLSGRDACMMAVTRLQLQRLSVMLTPDSCALVQSLGEQLAASFAVAGDAAGADACAAGSGATVADDGATEAAASDSGSLADSHAACGVPGGLALDVAAATAAHEVRCAVAAALTCGSGSGTARGNTAVDSARNPSSTGAPAWPEDLSERRFGGGSSVHSTHDALVTGTSHGGQIEAAADPAGMLAESRRSAHSGVWSDVSGTDSRCSTRDEPAVQDLTMSHIFEEGPSSTDGHSVGVSGSPCTATPTTSRSSPGRPTAAPALDQTLFVDASSTLIASSMLSPGDLTSTLDCPAAISEHSRGARPLHAPDAALLPQHASPESIMHDMLLAGGSVIAVGTCGGPANPGQGLSSAGIPTEQEADGVVLSDLQGSSAGLLSAVVERYVGAEDSPPPPRLQEPVVGRLGSQYPDSCRRVSVVAESVTVLLRPDGVPVADLAAAARMRGGNGLVRLRVAAVRLQHDTFPAGAPSHMRVAAAARAVTAQQAGFGARSHNGGGGGVQWRPLAAQLQHGPSDPRRDVLRMLVRVADTEQGTREASAWLRLPSLRLHLEQPCLLFLRVCCCRLAWGGVAWRVASESAFHDQQRGRKMNRTNLSCCH